MPGLFVIYFFKLLLLLVVELGDVLGVEPGGLNGKDRKNGKNGTDRNNTAVSMFLCMFCVGNILVCMKYFFY